MTASEKMQAVEKLKNDLSSLKDDYKNGLHDASLDFISDNAGACYSSDYICDAITDFADNNIDIYYNDLFEWCKTNFNYVNDAQNELGSSGDIIKDIQGGQFLYYEQQLYDDLDDLIRLIALDYLDNIADIIIEKKLTFDWDDIDQELNIIDNNNTFDDIKDVCDKCLNLEGVQNE